MTTCPHGYPQETCIICETLAAARRGGTAVGSSGPGAVPGAPPAPAGRRARGGPPAPGVSPEPAAKREVARIGLRPSALVVVLAAVAAIAVVWAVAGAVFAVLRLLELVAAVAVAGWVGYRVGLARGRRRR